MNALEKKMLRLLQELKKNFSVIELKAEFEAEGTRIPELMRLKELATRANLGLMVKIGGAEAITDMIFARDIGITGLIAPMIESSFALKKYVGAIMKYFSSNLQKSVRFGFNVETYKALEGLDEILDLKFINLINFITVGRGDLSSSIGLERSQVNSKKVCSMVENILYKAKKRNLVTCIGGNVDNNSLPFFNMLKKKGLLDKYETRKVVFKTTKKTQISSIGVDKALEFEMMWLENKKNYYTQIIEEDELRLNRLKNQIGE